MNDLEKRVTNLELALHSVCMLIEQTQPEHVQYSVQQVLEAHYNAGVSLGGFRANIRDGFLVPSRDPGQFKEGDQ